MSIATESLIYLASKFKRGGVIINEHTLTRKQTRTHVDALGQWFDFIHHDELSERLTRGGRKPFCLLTFDDGKRSNAAETAPELKRLGIPAVFYLPSDFLDEGSPLWFDRYNILIQRLGYTPQGLEPDIINQLPSLLLTERLDRAYTQYGVRLDTTDDDIRPMSWEEAHELMNQGFTIGAHGVRHAILTRETKIQAFADIKQSIKRVSSELGVQCISFAFPNGNYTAQLAHQALSCGVKTAMTTEPAWADSNFPLWRLPRIQLFGEFRPWQIELKLAMAATGWLLPNPDGTKRLYRIINRMGFQNSRHCEAKPKQSQ